MIFEYGAQVNYLSSINVDDPGNCALEVDLGFGYFTYFASRTTLGSTSTVSFGPINPDIPVMSSKYGMDYERFEYNISKLYKRIKGFISANYGKLHCLAVKKVDPEEVYSQMPDMATYFRRIGEEVY